MLLNHDPSIALGQQAWEVWRPEFAALHLVALALLVVVTVAWGRHGRRRWLAASGFITVAAIALVYIVTIRPSDIPTDWITILHHGLGRKNIMHLYTRGVHAGPPFAVVISAAAAGQAPTLHHVVWLNLLLALIDAAIFLHLAVAIAGPVWALPWTLVFALNPALFLASFSELPTHLLTLYFLAGVIAWAVLNDLRPQPRPIQGAAYTLCAVLIVLTAFIRPEVTLLGVLALALRGGYAWFGSAAWAAAGQRLRNAGERLLVFFSDHPATVVVLCAAGSVLSLSGIPDLVSRTWVAGLYPFNPSIFSLFTYLPMLALPLGVSIAILLGFIHAIVHFRRFGGLVLSLFILVRVYFAAWSEFFEMGRYLSYVLPAIFLLGLFGNAELEALTQRWRPNWRRAVRIGYLMTWFTLPLPGVLAHYARPEYHRSGGFSQLLLDRDIQREVRHLVALTENNPHCVFVARVVEDHGDPKVETQYDYVVFGVPVPQPIVVPEKEAHLDDVIAQYASDASCVRLYYGIDCNLTFADRCQQFIAGHRLVDEVRFWSHPYNNPLRNGYGAPEIVLATYAWP